MFEPELISLMRIGLSDPQSVSAIWTEEEMQNCIKRAVSDLSRVLPLEKMLDVTLDFEISEESFTSASAAGTWVSLANSHIKHASETVTTDPSGTTYTRDTDYTMDYLNGKITLISGGSMSDDTEYLISYDKLKLGFSIADIADELLRVERVEYRVANVPQTPASFDRWGSYITIKSAEGLTQGQLSDNAHVWVYYYAEHTPATSTANGSYPLFLDSVVIIGAEAYALFLRYHELIEQAATDLASAKTAIDSAVSTTDTALASTDLATIASKITLAETALTAIGTRVVAGVAFLTSGTSLINVVNLGKDVPENYSKYAEAEGGFSAMYGREAEGRIGICNSLVQQAAQHIAVAQTLTGQYTNKATVYTNSAVNNLESANRMRVEAEYKRDEFWNVLRDKLQLRRAVSTSSAKQPKYTE